MGKKVNNTNEIYENDTLFALKSKDKDKILKGIGKGTLLKLNNEGIMTLKDVLNYEGDSNAIVINKIRTLMTKFTLKENNPDSINHKNHKNPYESRYGTEWITEIKKQVH